MELANQKENVLKGIKITIASVLAIMAADLLDLSYYATAGIITILTIQNTKRETFITARDRTLAFALALIIAWSAFQIFGYGFAAFAIYILLFSVSCLVMKWQAAIAMDSVLITHFLAEQSMSMPILLNEIMLFFIGTFFGILVNLDLRRNENAFWQWADQVDEQMKRILSYMSAWILTEDKSEYEDSCFAALEDAVFRAEEVAWRNVKNTLFQQSRYEVEYISMRRKQMEVLKRMQESILMLFNVPKQAAPVSGLLKQVEVEYHRDNDIQLLMKDLIFLLKQMKQEELPKERQEFENRAVLYYILMQLKEFLSLKQEFMKKWNNN